MVTLRSRTKPPPPAAAAATIPLTDKAKGKVSETPIRSPRKRRSLGPADSSHVSPPKVAKATPSARSRPARATTTTTTSSPRRHSTGATQPKGKARSKPRPPQVPATTRRPRRTKPNNNSTNEPISPPAATDAPGGAEESSIVVSSRPTSTTPPTSSPLPQPLYRSRGVDEDSLERLGQYDKLLKFDASAVTTIPTRKSSLENLKDDPPRLSQRKRQPRPTRTRGQSLDESAITEVARARNTKSDPSKRAPSTRSHPRLRDQPEIAPNEQSEETERANDEIKQKFAEIDAFELAEETVY
ncbi:hypothetical protein H4R33_001633 [Dimargaris cristalligena]|uniref:Uncharacterized protein n=1 Tax=Dimargaris cristalligena TaxID=215637 RepID=A0A4P9ZTN0_9FUNG|nr:hypothetical protein H4R33_001633 [Dimargaris cristalligena]RKP36112.1 hypothetical protein BJ085DRAFT_35100 [Dimargaris cristalligena]|eukprot:RKP36112.1 hypothetical protein BJ085DRAFT_35100 [Dimargaris cristalligena]